MISNVYIAKNVYGGDGLGRLGDGRVVFVPGAWAGEQVRAEIVEEKKHFVKAKLVEVVEPSPDRQTPDERTVPGMVYSGLSCAGEVAAKEQQLREFFERARIAVSDEPLHLKVSGETPFNYRNKVVYHFAKQRGAWVIGYRTEPSNEIVDVTEDPLARPEINAKLGEVRRTVTTLLTTGPIPVRKDTERKGKVTVRWTQKSGVKWWIGDPPAGTTLRETTLGLDFDVPGDGFYQVNPVVGEELVRSVVAALKAQPARRVLDLYCGVGVFGLAALRTLGSGSLIGIESGRQAIDFAKRNAAALHVADAKFFAEEVGRNMRRIPLGAETAVVIDPPRDGLEPGVAKWLAASRAPTVVYVSCDPATLMRDLRELTRAYDVEKVRWLNMFPRTARFESIVVLKRRPAAS